MRKTILFILSLIAFIPVIEAQEDKMQVTRCAAVDNRAEIFNIYVDSNNIKWVANTEGLFKVYDLSYSERINLPASQRSLYQIPGGNADIRWSEGDLNEILGGVLNSTNKVTSAIYDETRDELWIGTTETGLYKLNTDPGLRLAETLDNSNSKLRSNYINSITMDTLNRIWVGTREGAFVKNGRKWDLLEKYFDVLKVAVGPSGVWFLTGEYFGPLDRKEKWFPVADLPPRSKEGKFRDFSFDKKGRLWLASDIITSYNPDTKEVKTYGPAQYFTSEFASGLSADQAEGIWIATADKGLFLIEKASNLSVNVIVENTLSCNGSASDAVLYARVVGGAAPYKYSWSNGSTEDRVRNLGPGTYQLTLTDSRGREKLAKVDIPDPKVSVNIKLIKTESDKSAYDGSAQAIATGGDGNYSYKWDNGESRATAVQLSEGAHTVTVVDGNGCESTAQMTISRDLKPLSAAIDPVSSIDCPGGQSGALQVIPAGGKGPYAFSWNNGQSGKQIDNLKAGYYEVSVTDALGSESTASYELKAPRGMTVSATATGAATTGQANGKATVIVSGGNGNYSYEWDNGESDVDAERLTAGEHKVVITDEANCVAESTVIISENVLPLTANIRKSGANQCAGDQSVTLRIQINGGKAPFSYSWSNGATTAEAENLSAGAYSVSITDAEGTTAVASYEVEEPNRLEVTVQVVSPATTDLSDGKAKLVVSGGTPQYDYSWDNGEITAAANRLAPGAHKVTVEDANGCIAEATFNITENILPLSASIEQTAPILCPGGSEAALKVAISGGKIPYDYQWSNGSTAAIQDSLEAGDYSVTVTDAADSRFVASYRVESPAPLKAVATAEVPSTTGKDNGQAKVEVSGGTAPYKYVWDTEERFQNARKLSPGIHRVSVTDNNGCTTQASVEIQENILTLSANVSTIEEIKCYGEKTASIRLKVDGGKGPFDFSWSQPQIKSQMQAPAVNELTAYEATIIGLAAGDYTVSIKDAANNIYKVSFEVEQPQPLNARIEDIQPASTNNEDGQATIKAFGGTSQYTIQWDNGESSASALKLAPGKHTVTVTDQNGCMKMTEVDISENILPLQAELSQSQKIRCSGEQTAALALSVNGGKKPFNITWSETSLEGTEIGNLAPGTYQVTISDAADNSISKTITIESPPPITYEFSGVEPASTDKENGQATIRARGGSGSLDIKWDNNEKGAAARQLSPGEHTVTITDENGCSTTATINIDENILPIQLRPLLAQPISCNGRTDGQIKLIVSGGKKPFEYQWSKAEISGSEPEGLSPGEYRVTVTDAIGQTAEQQITLEEPEVLSIETKVNALAKDENTKNGKASVRVRGGTYPYFYEWDNGEKRNIAQQLGYGKHTITVKDKNGCSVTEEIFVDKRKIPELEVEELEEGKKIAMEALQFDADSTVVKDEYYPVLDELYEFLSSNRAVKVEIGGHTNSLPPAYYCDELSTARAKSVADYLISKGISRTRVLYRGYGKRELIASDDTPEGRRKNQRIEIKILDF